MHDYRASTMHDDKIWSVITKTVHQAEGKWYLIFLICMWSKYNKELAMISNKAMDDPGYMKFQLINST